MQQQAIEVALEAMEKFTIEKVQWPRIGSRRPRKLSILQQDIAQYIKKEVCERDTKYKGLRADAPGSSTQEPEQRGIASWAGILGVSSRTVGSLKRLNRNPRIG